MVVKAGLYGLIPACLALLLLSIVIPVERWQTESRQLSEFIKYDLGVRLWNTRETQMLFDYIVQNVDVGLETQKLLNYTVVDLDVGLWTVCETMTVTYTVAAGINSVEMSYTSPSGRFDIMNIAPGDKLMYIRSVRALLLTALVLTALSILATLVKYLVLKPWLHEKQQILIGHMTAFLTFLAGSLVAGVIGVYNQELHPDGSNLHFCFYGAIVAWLLTWLAAGFFLVGSLCIGARMYPHLK